MTIVQNEDQLAELPPYSVIVALDDETDVRVKMSSGAWSVSSRFTGLFAQTFWIAKNVGFEVVHAPEAQHLRHVAARRGRS